MPETPTADIETLASTGTSQATVNTSLLSRSGTPAGCVTSGGGGGAAPSDPADDELPVGNPFPYRTQLVRARSDTLMIKTGRPPRVEDVFTTGWVRCIDEQGAVQWMEIVDKVCSPVSTMVQHRQVRPC